MTQALTVLVLPGWLSSGPDHWQTRWQIAHGYRRVEQHDWTRPLRGDWQIQLEEAILAAPSGVVLVAHSLGCHLVAAWAAHSQQTARVAAALLVAPPDLELEALRGALPTWKPLVRSTLPFSARLLFSQDDPYATPEFSHALARDWGAAAIDLGIAGHVNSASGLGDWPDGHRHLLDLIKENQDLTTV